MAVSFGPAAKYDKPPFGPGGSVVPAERKTTASNVRRASGGPPIKAIGII
jgi:hypothetical protein